MTLIALQDLIALARENSPFYRDLYRDVPAEPELHQLPPVDQKAFWEANTVDNNQLLTAPHNEGILFKSGGTTGNPKFSFFTNEEWTTFCRVFGETFPANGMKDGDRVINLFYAGELYASFVFITDSLKHTGKQLVQLPVGGATDYASITHILSEQHANVLVGVPTTLLHLAEYIRREGPGQIPLSAIYFGGESMYPDQREFLSEVFPGARLTSIGYASVDAGLLGRADLSCEPDEHRVIGEATIVEIVDDETGLPIEEVGRPGKVLITNLTRSLMPIIRYPAGDRAEWVEPPGKDRKFRLLGRSEEGARVGPMTIYYEDMHSFLAAFAPCPVSSFQMRVTHSGGADTLELRAVPRDGTPEEASKHTEALLLQLAQERPMIAMLEERKFIHPVEIVWLRGEDLLTNGRTGKLRHVIDDRKEPTA